MYEHHMDKYYNTALRNYMYLNGKCLNQSDEVLPHPSWLDFGIRATGCEMLIRSKIQHITQDVTMVTA